MGNALEVHFRYRPGHRPDIDGLLATVTRVFSENRVDVTFARGTDAPLVAAAMETVRISECVLAVGDHERLFDNIALSSPPQVVVFVVASIADAEVLGGCAAHPPSKPGVVITEAVAAGGVSGGASSGRWVLAHELGHILGLQHVDGTNRLMCTPATRIGASVPVLDIDECRTVAGSSRLGDLGALPRDLSLGGLRRDSDEGIPSVFDTRRTPERRIRERDLPIVPTRTRSPLDP